MYAYFEMLVLVTLVSQEGREESRTFFRSSSIFKRLFSSHMDMEMAGWWGWQCFTQLFSPSLALQILLPFISRPYLIEVTISCVIMTLC